MIEVYKIIPGKYDSAITPTLIISDTQKTRGNVVVVVNRNQPI